jgi:MFS family permease
MALQGGCHSLLPLLMLRAVVGFGEAALWVGAATWATDLASPGRRAEATSYQSAAVFVGLGLGPVVGNWLSTREDYTAGFVLSAVCMGISAVVVLAVHDDRADLQHVTNDSPPWWHALLHPAGLTTGVVLALAMVGYTAWAGFLALRADEVGTNPGTIFAVYSALVLCVRVLGARLPERIGLGRCAAAALSGITVGLVVMAAVDGVTGLWVGSILAAGGVSLMYPALTALSVNQVSDAERTAVVSTFTMFFEVGAGIGGLLCGAVASVSSYQGGFAVGAMAVVVGLAVLWFAVLLPRRRDPAVWDLTRPSGPPPVQ